jgi:hypothetical protein
MIPERDIWRTALSMIECYGCDAALEAGERSDAFTKSGKIDESETWQRILLAITRLRAAGRHSAVAKKEARAT